MFSVQLVPCPVCGAEVTLAAINRHLDGECSGFQSSGPDSSQNEQSSNQDSGQSSGLSSNQCIGSDSKSTPNSSQNKWLTSKQHSGQSSSQNSSPNSSQSIGSNSKQHNLQSCNSEKSLVSPGYSSTSGIQSERAHFRLAFFAPPKILTKLDVGSKIFISNVAFYSYTTPQNIKRSRVIILC
jgi:hypothetical protein